MRSRVVNWLPADGVSGFRLNDAFKTIDRQGLRGRMQCGPAYRIETSLRDPPDRELDDPAAMARGSCRVGHVAYGESWAPARSATGTDVPMREPSDRDLGNRAALPCWLRPRQRMLRLSEADLDQPRPWRGPDRDLEDRAALPCWLRPRQRMMRLPGVRPASRRRSDRVRTLQQLRENCAMVGLRKLTPNGLRRVRGPTEG